MLINPQLDAIADSADSEKHAFAPLFPSPGGILNKNASPTVVAVIDEIAGERWKDRRTTDPQRLRHCGCPSLGERRRMIEVFPVPRGPAWE